MDDQRGRCANSRMLRTCTSWAIGDGQPAQKFAIHPAGVYGSAVFPADRRDSADAKWQGGSAATANTDLQQRGSVGQHEAPSGPLEAAIAEIWTELIQPARAIGRNDNFFEMGGHSLLALRALQRMEKDLDANLDIRVLFQDNLADIASRIEMPHNEPPVTDMSSP